MLSLWVLYLLFILSNLHQNCSGAAASCPLNNPHGLLNKMPQPYSIVWGGEGSMFSPGQKIAKDTRASEAILG